MFFPITKLILDKKKDSGAGKRSRRRIYRKSRMAQTVSLICLLLLLGAFIPAMAHASIIGDIISAFIPTVSAENSTASSNRTLATMPLLKPAMSIDPAPATGSGGISIVDNSALMAEEGPSGTIADIEKTTNGIISTYVVREGDTLTGVAQLFSVTPSTILWANDLPRGAALKPGQKLTILPVTGVIHTVKKGDTLASIAKTRGGNAAEIGSYNGVDDSTLAVGVEIIIPNGEVAPAPVLKVAAKISTKGKVTESIKGKSSPAPAGSTSQVGYYIAPLGSYVKTQGVHGYNAVDLAASVGTPIYASAAGDVIVAKQGGWNGGYGSYVVIKHNNGTQTLYAHMSDVAIDDGAHVTRGQVIGYVGATGIATGPHVHFEIRNGIRNPF